MSVCLRVFIVGIFNKMYNELIDTLALFLCLLILNCSITDTCLICLIIDNQDLHEIVRSLIGMDPINQLFQPTGIFQADCKVPALSIRLKMEVLCPLTILRFF